MFYRAAAVLVALAWSSLVFCSDIHDAAAEGDLAKVKSLLLENPALISTTDSSGITLLNIATDHENKDMVELLLAHNADVNGKNDQDETPLEHMAAVPSLVFSFAGHGNSASTREVPSDQSSITIAELLIAHGASLNVDASRAAKAPLLRACKVKDWRLAQLLIRKGASTNIAMPQTELNPFLSELQFPDKGWTPLHYAAAYDSAVVATLLIAHKAQVNAKGSLGETPLRLARIKGHKRMMDLLRQNGGRE
jgi:ankyrin repeat protein